MYLSAYELPITHTSIHVFKAEKMIGNLRSVFIERLDDLEWMDQETRERAEEKVCNYPKCFQNSYRIFSTQFGRNSMENQMALGLCCIRLFYQCTFLYSI